MRSSWTSKIFRGPALGLILGAASITSSGAESLGLQTAAIRAQQAASYLLSVETAEGRFLYEFDFLAGRFSAGDNIVRQAGTGYVLAQYLVSTGDTALVEPVTRALGYYVTKSVPHGTGLLVSEDGTAGGGSAGATALALLAELFYFQATGESSFASKRLAWLRGLQALQLPSGGFEQNPGDGKEESYANGEAWMALALHALMFPQDVDVAATLAKADERLIARYGEQTDLYFSHWGLMAAALRHEATNDERFLSFVIDLATTYTEELVPETPVTANSCSMVEGLTAAAGVLTRSRSDERLREALLQRLENELARSLALQLQEGQTKVEFGNDRYYQDPKLSNFAGGFLNSGQSLRIRIDLTMHCLSALIRYQQLRALVAKAE